QPRLGCDTRQEAVDIGGEIFLGHGDRRGARRFGGDRVHEEAVPAVEHFVAGAGIAAREHADELVRAGAADDALRIEPVAPRQGLAQLDGGAVGIAVDLARRGAISLDGARAWAERALIRSEADDARDAGHFRLAAD